MRRAVWFVIAVSTLAVIVRSTAGPPPPTPNPPGTFRSRGRAGRDRGGRRLRRRPGLRLVARHQAPFTPLLDALADEAVGFAKPVLVIHGDSHEFTTDHPLKPRLTNSPIGNVTRLKVPGSPLVGWVRVVVTPGTTPSFACEQRLVPRWKYW